MTVASGPAAGRQSTWKARVSVVEIAGSRSRCWGRTFCDQVVCMCGCASIFADCCLSSRI